MTSEMFNGDRDYLSIPQVRIKVDYSGGYSTLNLKKFGLQFEGKIANPSTFLYFIKQKVKEQANRAKMISEDTYLGQTKISGGAEAA